jgi:hypothetical protein
MSEPFDYADVWDEEVDAIIEEIWEVRRKMWQRFDNDPVKMGNYYRERERRGGPRFHRMRWGPRQRVGFRRFPACRVRR